MITKLMEFLRVLENTTSTNEKEALITKWGNDGQTGRIFKEMLVWALDPYRMYGLKRLPNGPALSGSVGWIDITDFLREANARKWRGIELHAAFNDVAGRLKGESRELFNRIVLKDLRCGVGATLVNKCFPNLIPQFGVMLANPLQERQVASLSMYGVYVYIQPKLNGDRCVAICEEGKPTGLYSRNGHALLNYNEIATALTHVQRSSGHNSLVFDGEVICGDFFKTRGTKKLAGNEAKDAVFYCFDVIDGTQWKSGFTDQFRQRNQALLRLQSGAAWQHATNLVYVPTWKLRPEQLNWEFLCKVRDWLLKRGFEGLMVRPNMPYNFDTRSSLYKLKVMDTMDCMIEEILLGEEGKKHAHHAGAILVRLEDGETLCKAGLKLSDAQRDEMWKNRAQYVGKVAEIQYQDKTRNKDGSVKLQFPVYLRVREDKS